MLTGHTVLHDRQELRAVGEHVERHTYLFHDEPVVSMKPMRGIERSFCPVTFMFPLQTT